MMYEAGVGSAMSDFSGDDASDEVRGGVFGAASRQAELMAMAEEDTYSPPSNGEVTERQVQEFIRVMDRAAELRAERDKRLQQIAQKADEEQEMSLSDFGQMMGGVVDIAGLQSAEIEVVKTGDGNWAEHQWVRESLRTAWVQKDINEAVAHNYRLYQEYEEDLAEYIAH
jgi:hypothetical protein